MRNSDIITIKKMWLLDGKMYENLKYMGTIEMFFTQLSIKDFVLFGSENGNVMINSENIIRFEYPTLSDNQISDFVNKYIDVLMEEAKDLDFGYELDEDDDDDPKPPKGPNKRGSHLKIIK